MVKCLLCNKEMRIVNNFHLESIHKITFREYKEMFPEAKTHSDSTIKKMKYSSRISQIGRKYSLESRKKMSNTRKRLIASGKVVTPFMIEDKHGENNPAWGNNRRTNDEIRKTKEKLSKIITDYTMNNKMNYQYGSFISNKLNKKFHFRSSYEMRFFKIIDSLPFIVSYDYECVRIPYSYNGITRTYIPDFLLKCSDNKTVVVEVGTISFKLYKTSEMEYKYSAAIDYCKNKGFDFVIVTEDSLKDMEDMKNSVNCWDDLSQLCHNITGNGKCDGLKNKLVVESISSQVPERS